MDISELISTLTEGLPAEQAAVVRAAIERDAVKTKASGWKQQKEYDTLVAKQTELQAELDGDAAQGKLGAKAYREWYEKNFSAVQKLQERAAAYEAKYGTLEAPTATTTTATATTTAVAGLTKEDVEKLVNERIQTGYAPRWSELLTNTGSIVQKHILAGRKQPIDFKKLAEMASDPKFNGNLEAAYDEYDKPEREKSAKAQTDAEVDRRVKEELQKRGADAFFPAGADMSNGALAARAKKDVDSFDPVALKKDLVQTWVTGSDKTQ